MRNYVIGTSDYTGRHLNMVQAENVQAALAKAGIINPGLVPRRDMATHADVDYIYVEEPTDAVDTCENEHVIPYPEIRTLDDLMACFSKAVYEISQDNVFPRLYHAYLQSTFGAIFTLERPGLYLSVQTLTGERLADTTCLRTNHNKYVHWTQVSRKDLEEATAYVKSILRIA